MREICPTMAGNGRPTLSGWLGDILIPEGVESVSEATLRPSWKNGSERL